MPAKNEVLARLQQEVLCLQGYKAPTGEVMDATLPGTILSSFPNAQFPFAAVHEFYSTSAEESTASCAFVSGILSPRLVNEGMVLWIGAGNKIFPPALRLFGLYPEQVIFLYPKKEKDVLWAMEEALKCKALVAVISELQDVSFTASRRFQLAIESTGVGCFVLRQHPKNKSTAAVTRWHIKPVKSNTEEGLPGVGHPRWQVNLLKVRHGKTGSWDIEWKEGGFRSVSRLAVLHPGAKKKTG